MAKYSEKQNKWTQDYIKRAYDTITLRVPKGTRDKYNAYAKLKGKSLTSIIIEFLENEVQSTNI